jgi:hypothetical protein
MARGNLKFRQTDLTRALKAARAAGLEVARIEMDTDGRPVLVIGKPESRVTGGSELDQWRAKHAGDAEGR